jgi:hypothetical protein
VSGAVYEGDDAVGSSHDADVDAGFEDDQPASDLAAGSDDPLEGVGGLGVGEDRAADSAGGASHAADRAAGYDE